MKVTLLSVTDPKIINQAYGICTGKEVEDITKWIARGHTSPLEHASATFRIEGISRSCLAQLTRHRIASYSVESMRYCNVEDNEVIVPKSFSGKWENWYKDRVYAMQDLYTDMIANGIPKEDARFVLPIATTTQLIMTMNFRSLRNFFDLRMDSHAQWEIRNLATEMWKLVVQVAPDVFKDYKIPSTKSATVG